MKLLALCILRKEPAPATILASQYDVSSFGFFQRSSVQEFLSFFASTLTDKTSLGVRQAVEQDSYVGYVYAHPQGLTGVVISDHQYPQRVAFTLLNKILEEFLSRYPRTQWMVQNSPTSNASNVYSSQGNKSSSPSPDSFSFFGYGSNNISSNASLSTSTTGKSIPNTPFPQLKDYLIRYQDPKEADPMMKVQKEIDETKVIPHKTIESLLDRGEKLDHLVDKSEKLSAQSKGFYKVARKTNSCCFLQ